MILVKQYPQAVIQCKTIEFNHSEIINLNGQQCSFFVDLSWISECWLGWLIVNLVQQWINIFQNSGPDPTDQLSQLIQLNQPIINFINFGKLVVNFLISIIFAWLSTHVE